MSTTFTIGKRAIGPGYPCYIIAEMSANHAGDINQAIKIIHAAKQSGADCIKIQTYTPDTMTIDCDKEYFHIRSGLWQGENLYSLYQKAQTPWEWQRRLKDEAEKLEMDFLSTPFDRAGVDFLEGLGVTAYKIASFELVDIPLIKYIAATGKPVILSTGMGTLEEIGEAVSAFLSMGNEKLCLLKCSSAYPAIPEDMNLKTMQNLKDTFSTLVGLSDHSLGSIGALTAVAMGACVIEKHLCLSRDIVTPDSAFSMEPGEFKQMTEDIRTVEKAIGRASYSLSEREQASRVFRRSIFVVQDIKKGDQFTTENIRVIRPGHGLAPKHYEKVLGLKAATDLETGTPLAWEMTK